jgi:hypothetical protein
MRYYAVIPAQNVPGVVLRLMRAAIKNFSNDDKFFLSGIYSRPEYNPPFRIGYTYTSDSVHPTLTFATGFPSDAIDPTQLNAGSTSLISYNPAMAWPVVYHWSLSLRQQVSNYLIDTNYIGAKGTHLSVQYNINQDYPGAGTTAARRPYHLDRPSLRRLFYGCARRGRPAVLPISPEFRP